MALQHQNFTMYSGEDKIINYSITDSSGNPANLSSGVIGWSMSRVTNSELLLDKVSGTGVTVVSAVSGLFYVTLDRVDTSGYQGDFYTKADFVSLDNKYSVLAVGYVTLNPNVA